MSIYKCHLFDVDGTLVDSAPVIMASLMNCLRQRGIKDLPEPELRSLALGSPLKALNYYGIDSLDSYWKFYEIESSKALLFFKETKDILHQLKQKGCAVGVVSSLKNQQLRMLLHRFELYNEFDVVIGWQDCNMRKPNPHPILMALKRICIPPEMATYTGDSDSDMAAATRAGVCAIHAAWGGNKYSGNEKVIRMDHLQDILDL